MKEDSTIKSRILFPLQLAEDANRGFIKVIQQINRLINYDLHTTRPEAPDSRPRDMIPYSRDRYRNISSRQDKRTSPVAPIPPSVLEYGSHAHSAQDIDGDKMVTLLFSDFAEERLSAIRWISAYKYGDVLPMLESILLIEDNHQVYEEACNLINILRETDIETHHRE